MGVALQYYPKRSIQNTVVVVKMNIQLKLFVKFGEVVISVQYLKIWQWEKQAEELILHFLVFLLVNVFKD